MNCISLMLRDYRSICSQQQDFYFLFFLKNEVVTHWCCNTGWLIFVVHIPCLTLKFFWSFDWERAEHSFFKKRNPTFNVLTVEIVAIKRIGFCFNCALEPFDAVNSYRWWCNSLQECHWYLWVSYSVFFFGCLDCFNWVL